MFVDTGAWIALFVPDDANHSAARAVWEGVLTEKIRVFTSNYVIDESITAVRAFGGHERAVRLGSMLFGSEMLQRLLVNDMIEREAWALFKRYDDQEFSFTDCTSFALMKTEGISLAFAFDSDFVTAGFSCAPGGT